MGIQQSAIARQDVTDLVLKDERRDCLDSLLWLAALASEATVVSSTSLLFARLGEAVPPS
jgi:hypothetical protein